jgi:hypothetical protein
MGLDKFSNLGSFEEMAEAQDSAPEVAKTAETEVKTEVATEVATEVTTDNVETSKTE